MLYIEKPIFILLPIILSAWQILVYFINKKINLSDLVNLILNGIAVVGHAVAIFVIFMSGGDLYDALAIVLLSGALSLLLSPKADAVGKEENN
jgi:hypothetical protein